MTDQLRADALERLADGLVRLMGEYYARQPDAPAYDDEWFLEWLARDARLRQSAAARRRTAAQADAFADRVLAAGAARRYGVARAAGHPAERIAAVTDTTLGAVDRAARAGCVPCSDLAVAAGAGRELWNEECERWVARPRGMPPGRYVALRVAGDSMTPLLHAGDTILVRLGPEVSRDTIVVARRPDEGYVVKCVRALRGRAIELSSLNPDYPPVIVPRRPDAVVGTVVLRWCAHGEASERRP